MILLDYRMPDLDRTRFTLHYRATDGLHAPITGGHLDIASLKVALVLAPRRWLTDHLSPL